MSKLQVSILALLLTACSTAPPTIDKEAVEDFILAADLETADLIRTQSNDNFHQLNQYYVIYNARREHYLLKFARRCFELDTNRVTPDKRWDDTIRPGHDTLRGCRIDEIYSITEEQARELRGLGDAPGSGNN